LDHQREKHFRARPRVMKTIPSLAGKVAFVRQRSQASAQVLQRCQVYKVRLSR
jgi:hypothetical protein